MNLGIFLIMIFLGIVLYLRYLDVKKRKNENSIYDLYNGDTDWSAGLLRTQTLLDRIDPIEYQLYEVKKSDWLTWLDLPKNAALKAATFSYEKIDD